MAGVDRSGNESDGSCSDGKHSLGIGTGGIGAGVDGSEGRGKSPDRFPVPDVSGGIAGVESLRYQKIDGIFKKYEELEENAKGEEEEDEESDKESDEEHDEEDEEDHGSAEGDEEEHDSAESDAGDYGTGSDEGHSTDPGYDYRKDGTLLLTDADIFGGDFSFDPYLDRLMANTDSGVHLTAAVLYSVVNCQPLGERGFPRVSRDEAIAITHVFLDPDYPDSHGLHLGGRKYTIKRGHNIIRGVGGPYGCAIVKSSETLIIGIFQRPMTFSECELVVGDVRDRLSRLGY